MYVASHIFTLLAKMTTTFFSLALRLTLALGGASKAWLGGWLKIEYCKVRKVNNTFGQNDRFFTPLAMHLF